MITIVPADMNSEVAGESGDLSRVFGDIEITAAPGRSDIALPTYTPTADLDDNGPSIEAEDADFVAACRGRLARHLEDES